MNFTNKHDVPDYIFEWLVYDDYDHHEGVISTTTLLGGVRKHILYQRHKDDLTIDASDMLDRRLGSALHSTFEVIMMDNIEKEKRIFATVNGMEISGKYDMLKDVGDKKRLIDIKTTSVWKYIKKDFEGYKNQLSIYRYLLKRNGVKVSQTAEICFVFTDWKRNEVAKYEGYPPLRTWWTVIDLYGVKPTEDYIKERLALFKKYQDVPDKKIPRCSDEELWLTKKGKANACNYCDVRCVCDQYRELLNNNLIYNMSAGVIDE